MPNVRAYQGMVIWFLRSSACILLLTGLAKLLTFTGKARILAIDDPIMGVTFAHLMFIAGLIELSIAISCMISKRHNLALFLIAWLATGLTLYRLGLWMVGWHRPCSCLGNLTDAIRVSPQVADNVMKGVLAYLLVGSYGILFHQWWKRKAEERIKNDEVKSAGG
jgi:hypothetical protein